MHLVTDWCRVLVKAEGGRLIGLWNWKWVAVPITSRERRRIRCRVDANLAASMLVFSH